MPKCHTPSPCGLSVLRRPASGFAQWQATAQASRSRGWRRHCLAFWRRPATVEPSLSSAQQTFRQANVLEHPVQQTAEFLGFSWRPNRPLPNMLFKGTPTRYAVCLPLTPALGHGNTASIYGNNAPGRNLAMQYKEIVISEWRQLLDLEPEFGGAVYRGQSDAKWPLETALFRTVANNRNTYGHEDDDFSFAERSSLRSFKSRAHFYLDHLPATEDEIAWLAVMQHHGTPTRLLDFSYSLYVACYFALINTTTDSCVWSIDDHWLRSSGVEFTKSHDIEPTNTLRYGQLSAIYKLANNIIKNNNFDVYEPQQPAPHLLMIEIERQIPRLAVQQGVFLMPTDPSTPFEKNLQGSINSTPCSSTPVKKIVLPYEIRNHALMHLRMMNITAETLFPGIDGFASSLIQHDMI